MKTFRIEIMKKVSLYFVADDIATAAQKAKDLVTQNKDMKVHAVVDVEAEEAAAAQQVTA